MTARLGVAVVGLGIGQHHAEAFAALPACRVMAVCDLDPARAREVAATLPGCAVETSFDAVLARTDVNVVSIATYDDAHFGQVVQALKAGRHVFVEKPICRTDAEVAAIGAALAAAKRPLVLGSNLVLRGAQVYRWLRAEIASGSFGEIYAFDGDYLYGRLHKITEGWRRDTDDYSVMHGGAIHLIDLMLWLTGERPNRVLGVGNAIASKGTGFRYNDFAAATCMFPSGMVGRITANFGCVHRHQHVVRVFGTKRTFILDDAGPRVMASRDPEIPPERLDMATLPAHKGVLIPGFVSDILAGRPDEGVGAILDGIRVANASDRSMRSGEFEAVIYE